MTNAIAKSAPTQTLRQQIAGDYFKQQIALSLPKHMTPDRFVRVGLTALMKTPKLLDCTPESVIQCMLNCSALGLEPDGRRAHLIPYGNVCTLIVDYKGIVELAKRSGDVSGVFAQVVCDKDNFSWENGVVKHQIDWKNERGAMYAAYATITFKDGSTQTDVMTKGEIDAIKKRSRASGSGPWVTDYNEMAKKGLALDTPIPTSSGWTTMGEIRKGQVVFDMNGVQVLVLAVSEIKKLQCFKVAFSNGESIVCDDEHKWVSRFGKSNANKVEYKSHTVNELYEAKQEGLSVTVPMQGALEICESVLPIDPYLFGYWLGDGTSRAASITCGASDKDHVVKMALDSKYKLGKIGVDKRSGALCVRLKGGFLDDLRSLGVLQNKHVPEIYLRASKEQRLALLAGLVDSDGHIDKQRGRVHFYNKNQKLSAAVAELVSSLGDVPQVGIKKMNGFGVVCEAHFVGWQPTACPSQMPRKIANFKPRKIAKYRAIESIEMIASVPTRCIAVSGNSKTYLAGKSMVPTHNTVFRRASKWITLSPEVADAMENEDAPFNSASILSEPIAAKPIFDKPAAVEADEIPMGDSAPAAEPSPEQETAKAFVARMLTEAKVPFDDVRDYITNKNIAKGADSWASYDELPESVCEVLAQVKTLSNIIKLYGKK